MVVVHAHKLENVVSKFFFLPSWPLRAIWTLAAELPVRRSILIFADKSIHDLSNAVCGALSSPSVVEGRMWDQRVQVEMLSVRVTHTFHYFTNIPTNVQFSIWLREGSPIYC